MHLLKHSSSILNTRNYRRKQTAVSDRLDFSNIEKLRTWLLDSFRKEILLEGRISINIMFTCQDVENLDN